MTQVLGFLLFIAALVVHEAGHAIAMRRRGIEISEAGLFFPVGKMRLTIRTKLLPYPLVIGVIPLGAYVKPSEEGQRALEKLSYKDKAICESGGIITNLFFGGVLVAIALFMDNFSKEGGSLIAPFAWLAVSVVVLVFRRFISVIMPIFGVASLMLLIVILAQSMNDVGGPVAIVKVIAGNSATLADALYIGGIISVSIGQFNMTPLFPLDGGHVMSSLFTKWGWKKFAENYQLVTGLAFLAFFVFVIVHDFI